MTKIQNHFLKRVSKIVHLDFGLVSDFGLRHSNFSSRCSQEYRHSLNRPERSQRADSIAGKCLCPMWPSEFQHVEGALHRQNQGDETELPDFDADIEAQQRQRQVLPRQAGARQRAGEAEPMQQPERERHDPRMPDREARLARATSGRSPGRETGCSSAIAALSGGAGRLA